MCLFFSKLNRAFNYTIYLKWLKEYAKNNVAHTTYKDYKSTIVNHLIPALGRLKLKKLHARHIIKY
ncbi:integrase-like protein [Halanaerobium saccharolyticum]|uniref:Integrase-like protein n=1 Tax=Halanaerobium saccharolyticum TaxID=43595 RepID=A0A4R7YYH9_9FIRM|nr:integrase-like protein [Halanaerobium saccharolyticum]TDW02619.1 integrase-like protein [Halanaerobium saccharolyticum]TDX60750.1 integrase-like protein [Halanaerobium saccharolyticum]